MTWLSTPSVLLTVRGKSKAANLEEARGTHNMTAGSAEGIATARSLGDLSHKVYTPLPGTPADAVNELLFIDIWKDAEGLGKVFSDPQVQAGGDMLFSEREAAVWMPAEGAYGFDLPSPMHQAGNYLGIARGPIGEPQAVIDALGNALEPTLSAARQLGQVSHHLFIRVPMPGDEGPAEALGVDLWSSLEGMGEFYESLSGFEGAYAAEPATSVWEQGVGGIWTEW